MSAVPVPGVSSPASTSEFIGRQAELERLDALLSGTARLITLVGPGGIGKTRLAAEALRHAHRVQHRPVYWARLAELGADTGVDDLVQSVVRTDVPWRSARDVNLGGITGANLQADRWILVLDNCEHVLTGIGAVIAQLLDSAPGLTILATTREPIGWYDEYILMVPPLSPRQGLELFRQRAELTGRPMAEDPGTLDLAAEICKHVDHNPLFIRLAAARLRHRSPAMLLRELTGDADDKRLRWSHGATVGAEARHRGVYDVIAWSFALCGAGERMLLERLSVFAAGYETVGEESLCNGVDLNAVIAVCADDELPAAEIEQLLDRLVERSLLSTHITATEVRWYLVESLRVFARGQLELRGPDRVAVTLHRHHRYYRDKVLAGQSIWYGPREQEWMDWAWCAWDNLLIAIETGLSDPDDAVLALETITMLLPMWIPFVKCGGHAVTRLITLGLAAVRDMDPVPVELCIRAQTLLCWISMWKGRTDDAVRQLDDCVATWLPEFGPDWRDTLGTDSGLPAPVEWAWGFELLLVGQDSGAIAVLDRARRKYVDIGDRIGTERAGIFHALASAILGEPGAALHHTERHLRRAMSSGSDLLASWSAVARAIALAKYDRPAAALTTTHAMLTDHVAEGDTWTVSWAVMARVVALGQVLAEPAAAGEDDPQVVGVEIARLVGAFQTSHRAMGTGIDRVPMIAEEIRRTVEISTAVIGARRYAVAAAEGAALRPEFDELRCYLLGTLSPERRPPDPPSADPPSSRWRELSNAECEVAVLVAAGWPNSAIAARRRSSIRTVDAQVAAIRQKLAVATRTAIVDHVPAELTALIREESERRPGRSTRKIQQRKVIPVGRIDSVG
ncbi:AAA family ATPase [Nocardia sp. NPDC050710]|uniref:ATP-binding protein n=1 Tax=Nocardia sp. NPDC050710 TaxID=3157220 RepID=UPI0034011D39